MATVPFNLIFCLLLGLGFTACASTQLRSGTLPWRRELGLILSFALLTIAPLSSYYYLLYPDWSWMYLLSPLRLPRGIGLAVIVVTSMMAPVGFLLGYALLRLLRARGPAALFGLLGALFMGLLFLILFCYRRFSLVGTYDDFQAGMMLRPVLRTKIGLSWMATTPVLLLAASLIGWYLWGYGRWLRQQALSGAPKASTPGTSATTSGDRARL